MNTNNLDMSKLIRYSIVIVGIFMLLKLIPRVNIETRAAVISTIVLFALYVFVENVFIKPINCIPEKEKLDGTVNSTQNMSDAQKVSSLFNSMMSNQSNVKSPIVQSPASSPTMTAPPAIPVSTPTTDKTPSFPTSSPYNTDGLKPGECKDCVKKTVDSEGMVGYKYRTDTQKYTTGETRAEAGVMKADNEMLYNDYFIMPITAEDEGSFEEGYSMLPPSKWYPVPPHPPVCVTEKKCPVCPVMTSGAPVDLKEWNDSRRITPGDVVNIDYAKDKMNSGR